MPPRRFSRRRRAADPVSGRALDRGRRRMTTARRSPPLPRSMTALPSLPLRPPGESVPLGRLEREFAAYRDRVFCENSRVLIKLLRRIPLLGAFHPVTIRLTDLATSVSVSVVDGFALHPAARETSRCIRFAVLHLQQSVRIRHADGERALRGDAGRLRQDDEIAGDRLAQRHGACGVAGARDELQGGADAAAPARRGRPQHDTRGAEEEA